MADAKLNPSLFDKLTVNDRIAAIVDDGRTEAPTAGTTQLRLKSATQIIRSNETAIRSSVRRELNWLLNTINLAASEDLARYPHVRTSVLNYGMPDLTGRVSTPAAVKQRAADIRQVITTFEPRLDKQGLQVEAQPGIGFDNAIRFVIRGDIASAVKAMPVQFFASIEVETGDAVVRD